MPRLFAAFGLTSLHVSTLGCVRGLIEEADPSWACEKWVPRENLHITSAFFGEVPSALVGVVADALARVASGAEPLELIAAGVRAVPSPGRATMLWAAYDDPGGMSERIARELRSAHEGLCEEVDTRPFRPHATLVRTRGPRAVPAAALGEAGALVATALAEPMSVLHATLFESVLLPTGPVYRELMAVPLGGA